MGWRGLLMGGLAWGWAACGAVPAPTELGSASGYSTVPWHPGHYVTVDGHVDTEDFFRWHPQVLSGDEVQGILKKIYWGDLETAPGEYDFSALDAVLETLAAHDKQLFVLVLDRTFVRGCRPGEPLPDHLYQNEAARSALSGGRQGCAAAVWDPAVMDQYIALMQALGDRYDGHPHFHGVAMEESALDTETDYDKAEYKRQLLRLFRALRQSMPRSLVLANLNYLTFDGRSHEENLSAIATVVAELGGGLTTPDSIPSRSTPFERVVPLFEGQVAIAPMVDSSFVDLAQDTPLAIARYNADLGASFLFWSPWHRDQEDYLQETVLPGLRQMQADGARSPQLHHRCPAALTCAPP